MSHCRPCVNGAWARTLTLFYVTTLYHLITPNCWRWAGSGWSLVLPVTHSFITLSVSCCVKIYWWKVTGVRCALRTWPRTHFNPNQPLLRGPTTLVLTLPGECVICTITHTHARLMPHALKNRKKESANQNYWPAALRWHQVTLIFHLWPPISGQSLLNGGFVQQLKI